MEKLLSSPIAGSASSILVGFAIVIVGAEPPAKGLHTEGSLSPCATTFVTKTLSKEAVTSATGRGATVQFAARPTTSKALKARLGGRESSCV